MARAFLGSLPHPDFADAQVRTAYLILLATVPGALIGFSLRTSSPRRYARLG